jgi:hypothetical protein
VTPPLFSSSAGSKRPGELECGCVISLVVSVEKPHGNIRWCLTHAQAGQLRSAMNLIFGYTKGAVARVQAGGYTPARAIKQLQEIGEFARKALPPNDTARWNVKARGPGQEVR